ncbi:MAG: ABC transporter ATP-binding protein [Chloroflexi bacterium]|nr:ABC transporter ATP-binding protein [Chloroflexota bacterium]
MSESRLRGLWRLLQGYRFAYFVAAISLGLAAASRSTVYLLLAFFVDDVLGTTGFGPQVPLVALGFVGLAVIQGVFTYLSGQLAGKTAESVTQRVRNYIYDHIQRLSFVYHDKTRTGELIQRATSDIDAVRRFFAQEAIGFGRITMLFLANFAALLLINTKLALLSVIVVPITVPLSYFFFKRISDAYESFQEQDALLSSVLQENLSGVRVVKAFARQDYERGKFETENWEKFLRGRKLLLLHSYFWPTSDILTGAQMLFGFYTGAIMTINGIISLGDYLAYAGLLVWIIWPIRNLGRIIVQMSTGLVSFSRVTDVVREEREPLNTGDYLPDEPPKGAIEFKQVSFEYEADAQVLKDVSFACEAGQMVALLGSTGSGKTTLVNLLPRFYDYSEGSIKLDGVELNRYPKHYLRTHIGIVQQEPFLFSRTIRENIRYSVGRDVSDEEVEEAAKAAAVHEVILTFPKGYDTLVGERGVTLSGGQKQRVTLARTLLKNPRILILDDATSSVDTETEAAIRTALGGLMDTRTTFLIAHRIQSVMMADLILVFDEGKVVQQGTHGQLLRQKGIYRDVFDIQTQIEEEVEREVSTVK